MDRHLDSLSGSRDKRFDRNRRDYNNSLHRKGGQYHHSDRRSKRLYRQGDSHSNNRSTHQNVLTEIRKLLKEIISSQQKALKLLDENREMDNRIASALEIIAAKTYQY